MFCNILLNFWTFAPELFFIMFWVYLKIYISVDKSEGHVIPTAQRLQPDYRKKLCLKTKYTASRHQVKQLL